MRKRKVMISKDDQEYIRQREMLIPLAMLNADKLVKVNQGKRVVARSEENQKDRWDSFYLGEMDRLVRELKIRG